MFAFDIAITRRSRWRWKNRLTHVSLDVVVYNAGIKRQPFVFMTKRGVDSVLHTNLDGFYRYVYRYFSHAAREKGQIVIISSTSGEIGQAGQVNYSASKAGLIGAAKALAREVARKNIWVNVVVPGLLIQR